MGNSLQNEIGIQRCLEKIKLALRHQGLHYSDVAERLDVSEVTVKRMLNSDDISLSRLYELADIVDLDISQLLADTVEKSKPHTYFTKEQDKAFAKEPHLASFLIELMFYEKSPEQIAAENNLTELSLYRYLRKLELLELINLDVGNKVKFLIKPPVGFAPDSLYLRQNIMTSIQQTAKRVLSDKPAKDCFMLTKPFRLHQDMYDQMLLDVRSVIDRYAEVSEKYFAELPEESQFKVVIVGHPYTSEEAQEATIINLDN